MHTQNGVPPTRRTEFIICVCFQSETIRYSDSALFAKREMCEGLQGKCQLTPAKKLKERKWNIKIRNDKLTVRMLNTDRFSCPNEIDENKLNNHNVFFATLMFRFYKNIKIYICINLFCSVLGVRKIKRKKILERNTILENIKTFTTL